MILRRDGITILELIVVFAILGLLLALLLPAVQSMRERARETGCKNNLHQINLAVGQFAEVHKHVPGPGAPGLVGGWTVDLLPFLEQKNLHDRIVPGTPIADAEEILLRQPTIFNCPTRDAHAEADSEVMEASHYVLVSNRDRTSCSVYDAPIDFESPWATGPELSPGQFTGRTGPHHRGFYRAALSQGVSFEPGG